MAEENVIKEINNYINSNFIDTDNYKECMAKITNLTHFLQYHKYNLKIDSIIDLLNNNSKFNYCIKVIFEENKNLICDGKLDIIFRYNLIKNALYAYCMINNINISEVDETGEYDEDDYSSLDGLDIYYSDIRRFKLLSFEEEQVLARKIKMGDEVAKEKFISHNLRLAVNIAKNYQGKGLSLEDLIGFGNLGLLRAVELFDPEKGYRFSTYATWWIRQSIVRGIRDTSKGIRVPVYLYDDFIKYSRMEDKLSKKLNRIPTTKEVGKELGFSDNKLERMYLANNQPVSLNETIGEDSDIELGETVPDTSTSVEEMVLDKELRRIIIELLDSKNSHLSEREIMIIYYRFGFDNDKIWTFEEIGKKIGITKQRVQQVEEKALRKLRASNNIELFDSYMTNPTKTLSAFRKLRQNILRRYSCDDGVINYPQNGKTIYEYFEKYTRDEIRQMIDKLNNEERQLLIKRYGSILDAGFKSILNEEERQIFYSKVFPKMKKLLAEIRQNNPRIDKNLLFSDFKDKKEIENVNLEKIVFSKNELTFLNKLKQKMEYRDYEKVIKIIEAIRSNEIYANIDIRELCILLLSLGYINNRYYFNNEIADLLSMDYEMVILLQKKVLYEFREIVLELDQVTGKTFSL